MHSFSEETANMQVYEISAKQDLARVLRLSAKGFKFSNLLFTSLGLKCFQGERLSTV